MMKHMLVLLKNFSIQGLGEDVSQLVTGLGIVHLDGPQVHLLLSQVIGHMKMPVFPGKHHHVSCPFNAGRIVFNHWCRLRLRAAKVHKKMP